MKKILVLNYEFPPLGGGASPVSYEIAKRLSETGDFDIDVVTMGYKGLPKYEEINKNFRVYRVWTLRSKKEMCYPWEQLTYVFTGYQKCKELLKKNKYDICHTHFIIPTGLIALKLKKKFDLDYVVTSHGSDVPGFNTDRFKLLHKFTGSMLREVSKYANKIISPSHYLKELIEKNIKIDDKDKVAVIPNGIDVNKFIPQVKKKMIFSSGRLLARKGFQYLIQAVSDEDMGYEVHIAGDGPMMPELKKLAEKSKTKVVLHGWLDNRGRGYKDLLEQSAIFVLVSETESFGMVLAEAMAAGCVIIASNTSGSGDTVGKAGLLVTPGKSEEIKNMVNNLIKNSNELRTFSAKSLEQVKEFDWNKVLLKYLLILK
jgi:glycosyltransferase involved in cell wall biosynthesis